MHARGGSHGAPAVLLAAVALLLIGISSGSAVLYQLGAQASLERDAWRRHGSALQWDFSRIESIVVPGSFGIDADDFVGDALQPTFRTHDLDLSLALPTPALPLLPISQARLGLRSEHALRIWIIAIGENGSTSSADPIEIAAAFDGEVRLPLPESKPAHETVRGLRLHLSGQPGQRVALRHLTLLTHAAYDDRPCAGNVDIGATVASCGQGPVRVMAPMFATPELLLRWRDRLRGTALVVIDAPLFSDVAIPDGIRFAIGAGCIAFALFLLGALAWRSRRLARGSAAGGPVALLAVAPIAVLLWFGVGSAGTTSIEAAAFIVCCVLLWLLHARRVQMRVLGDGAAWRAAAYGSLLLAPFLLALLLANLLDADGLRLRPIPADRFWFYPLWALLQQYLLLRVIAPRTRTPGRSAEAGAVLAGLLFALLHLPNFGLMLATFVAGTLWAWLGYRHRALLPLAASHALLGLMLVIVAPDWLLRSAEIGGRYLLPP